MPEAALEARGLSREFGRGEARVRALRGASLSVGRGEFVLVVGSSGSGKSTLLNLLGLLDRPTGGSVEVDGAAAGGLGDDAASAFRNRRIGFVFQFSNLLPDLTVLENVELPARMAGRPGARAEARRLLEMVGLGGHAHKRASVVSGGQAQRAAIARALVNGPAVVLADEPTGNLDSASAAAVVDLMKSTARRLGRTFVVVTHDRGQFGEVDRVFTVRDGLVSEGGAA